MKISLIVEGPSDKIILNEQSNWFNELGIELDFVITRGKGGMIKKAIRYYRAAIRQNFDYVIFLPDQDKDVCAIATREKIGMDLHSKAKTIVMKLEMEAWILADGQCIRDSINITYSPSGQTDNITDPKLRLFSIMRNKLGYEPEQVVAASVVAPYFSIERAARNNKSAKRFKEFIESIVEN